jgi:hypothetical protein
LVLSCAPEADQPDLRESRLAAGEARPGRELDPPAAAGAFAPNLASVGDRLGMTWLEPVEPEEGGSGHRLRFSLLEDQGWREATTIVQGDEFFANWADFPALIQGGNGDLVAHWLAKTAPDTYAYSIFLARSEDGGKSWEELGKLNSDDTTTEHGFVAFVPEGEGVRAFWLDGREMVQGGAMGLRTARIDGRIGPEELLDDRVCECCSNDAAVTAAGPVVVFRDRSDEELRDIGIVRGLGSDWSAPSVVAADSWRIEGCPVNGPGIDAAGERATVAWFTGARSMPSVRLAFSDDSGATFGDPIVVEEGSAIGRVDVALDSEGAAWVTWMTAPDAVGEIRLRRFLPQGPSGEALLVAKTSAARASGFPRLERIGEKLYLGWVEVAEGVPSRVRLREIPVG